MTHYPDPVLQELQILYDTMAAVRNWERRTAACMKAKKEYEATPTQRNKNRYELHSDALISDRNFAIAMLTRVGKRITIDGFHYRAIPSRLEIKKTRCNRAGR